jgi:pilus assembly protein CpaF
MKLVERLSRGTGKVSATTGKQIPQQHAPPPRVGGELAAVAARLHDKVIDRIDLAQVAKLERSELKSRLTSVVSEVLSIERITVSATEREALIHGIIDEIAGLGPLEPLLADATVSDVLVNTHAQVWVERAGRLELTDVKFRDEQHLINTIRRIVARVGRRVDESSPMVDARLPDGSRVNAILPPLALDGASLSIRRFGQRALTAQDLVSSGSLSAAMIEYLNAAVRAHCSILVAGGTGAGKTTLLNILSSFIPDGERIVTVEDAAELRLQQRHVVRLESRPPNLEGQGEVTIRDLVKNSLRMRPDRVVVGEVRGSEVLDMLQAMNTGHEGSMATLHANSARDAVSRLMTMLGMTGTQFSEEIMAQLIARAVHVIVHVGRGSDGKRRVSSIVEVSEQKGADVEVEEIFTFQASGIGPDGVLRGRFLRTGNTQFEERFAHHGVRIEGV